MPYIAYSRSPIHVRQTSGGVDPGFGVEGPVDPGFGGGIKPPVDPGYGHPDIGPIDPGFGVGLPPIASHPLPPAPGRPDNGLPTYPVVPGHDLPQPPNVWPRPPRPVRPSHPIAPGGGGGATPTPPIAGGGGRPSHPIAPPPVPISPEHPIYLPGGPDNSLPLPPGAVWPPLPPALDDTELMCLVWIVGVGYRWTVIDTSLKPDNELPPTTVPPAPDQGLPTTPPAPTHPTAPPATGSTGATGPAPTPTR
jgi:translation initiation factor IF-2